MLCSDVESKLSADCIGLCDLAVAVVELEDNLSLARHIVMQHAIAMEDPLMHPRHLHNFFLIR